MSIFCSLDLTQTPSIPCTVKILPLAPWPGAVPLRNAWYQMQDGYVIYTQQILLKLVILST